MPLPRMVKPKNRQGAIMILLTPEERIRFKAAAAKSGLGVGPWLRMLGLRVADSLKIESPPPAPMRPRRNP